MITRKWLRAILGTLASLPMSASLLAQSYGLGDQTWMISPATFRPRTDTQWFELNTADGFLYGEGKFVAPIGLPEGAVITRVCFDLVDDHPDAHAYLSARTHAWAPGHLPTLDLWIDMAAGSISGYGSACSGVLDHPIRSSDGEYNLGYAIEVDIGQNGGWIGIGGVRVVWHRRVSPPPNSASFGDVPVSDAAFPFIEALAQSGITAGCGGGHFCPESPLTRRQMAVFLSKALGLHWPN